jgi:hypothetical protein
MIIPRAVYCLIMAIYLHLSWASITYTYKDIYTWASRHHKGGSRAGTRVFEGVKGATDI